MVDYLNNIDKRQSSFVQLLSQLPLTTSFPLTGLCSPGAHQGHQDEEAHLPGGGGEQENVSR